jgi:hypothetical protein
VTVTLPVEVLVPVRTYVLLSVVVMEYVDIAVVVALSV